MTWSSKIQTVLVLLVAACSRAGAPDSMMHFQNDAAQAVRLLEVNVVTNYGHGEFQTQPASEHDQFYKIADIGAHERKDIAYLSLSEQTIDIRVTWGDGKVSRYNVGYVDDLFSASHIVTATSDRELLFDGRPANPVQSKPEENFGKFTSGVTRESVQSHPGKVATFTFDEAGRLVRLPAPSAALPTSMRSAALRLAYQ